jgi:hypothetical protein
MTLGTTCENIIFQFEAGLIYDSIYDDETIKEFIKLSLGNRKEYIHCYEESLNLN